jgi:alkylation response protein AidB-like acyl-CoA dehydrogenase
MDFELDADQKAIVDSLGTLLGRHAGPRRAIELEKSGSYDQPLHDALSEAGFFDIYDAAGALGAVLVIEQVARAAGVVSIAASAMVLPGLGLPAATVTALADENLRSPLRYAADAREVLSIHGARVGRIELAEGDVLRVPSAFMYPLGQLEQRNLRPSPVSVSPQHARDLWRLGLAAECVGTMAGALSLTVEYVKNRRQFGRAIGSFQAVQHRLAQCAVQLEGARYLTYEAAHRGGSEAIATAASYAASAARLVHGETHQLTGALGFTREHDLHVWSMRLCALRLELGGTSGHRRALAEQRWGLSS